MRQARKKQIQQPEQQQKKEKKSKPLMCGSYMGFGQFSVAAGVVFAAIGFFLGFNAVRIAVVAFFIMLGGIDLLFYSKYGGHS